MKQMIGQASNRNRTPDVALGVDKNPLIRGKIIRFAVLKQSINIEK